ncbi:glutathione S-transferase 2-like [Danaus plexippus]|uniref:glutathione S-transferase 2-like n=1 Tax=Danaus plexippus TaxID=13037 RepID=UPI002AB1A3B3|nr:glutathione S-transferase 2-like [Danaus plexippus]XP_032519386.2 glutathione S-transferase 2-like [Danaus plexippus]
MENVKVIYFPLKGMAEGIRLILAHNGQEFEDVRIPHEEWPAMKPNTPFGQLPILEINGKQYAQTSAIVRYLGRKYGLGGNNVDEDFEIDQNMEFFNDLRSKGSALFYEKDEKRKAALREDLQKNYYPTALAKLNDIIAQNNGHLALGRLTWADFMFAGIYDSMKYIMQIPDIDEKYPMLVKLQQKVLSLPRVKEFCDRAPKSDF